VDCGFAKKITLQNMMFPLKLADSLWKAKQIIKEFKPDVVIERWFCQRTVMKMASMMFLPR
jgi:UDP-N-acetylglucosamine--N-acetylmuramyl-(pentapeptide) pyrophosphoryl-undecaprenol N-acetylglucosamine transferase